jgi:hypothetical protein
MSSVGSAKSSSIPGQVIDVLKTSKIGYLAVTSKKGDLYSYPMTYQYSNLKLYMMTPTGAAKMKFMRANPNISFIVDNKKIALESCGAMIQGTAKILSMAKMIASIVSLGPEMVHFAKKYPGMFTFYARGKYLPDERKLYKYRFIRIDPRKIVFWTGYTFGKFMPEKQDQIKSDEGSKVETMGDLLATADEEEAGELDRSPADQDWLSELNTAVSNGVVSEDEMRIIGSYKSPIGVSENMKPGELSAGEKSILKKWKASKSRD